MKDFGILNYFLSLEISHNSSGYFLSQAKYAVDIVYRAGLTNSKVTSTLIKANIHLTPSDGKSLYDPTLYRQLVNSLIYLTVTHLDIAYAIHIVSQFMSTLCTSHYEVVLHIPQYIRCTLHHGLHFSSSSSLLLHVYFDAD